MPTFASRNQCGGFTCAGRGLSGPGAILCLVHDPVLRHRPTDVRLCRKIFQLVGLPIDLDLISWLARSHAMASGGAASRLRELQAYGLRLHVIMNTAVFIRPKPPLGGNCTASSVLARRRRPYHPAHYLLYAPLMRHHV